MVIEILRQEHRNIEKLLLVLERELSVFARGERPDYEVKRIVRVNVIRDLLSRVACPATDKRAGPGSQSRLRLR